MFIIRSLVVAATILVSITACADTLQGRVVSIADGDTVTVLDGSNTQTKIRLMGIDAPEKKQAFGQRSKQHLSDLVFDKHVTVEYSKKDRYGRTVGKLLVEGLDANLEQVKAGMAWHYKQYQKEQTPSDRSLYSESENRARAARIGLWADPDPTPPWGFRHR
ncbi:MAG: thermonuclease family protein [Sideroxyarcus sp.]|nr:thermonuclease family protein [Sideroxyarcus sp.]